MHQLCTEFRRPAWSLPPTIIFILYGLSILQVLTRDKRSPLDHATSCRMTMCDCSYLCLQMHAASSNGPQSFAVSQLFPISLIPAQASKWKGTLFAFPKLKHQSPKWVPTQLWLGSCSSRLPMTNLAKAKYE